MRFNVISVRTTRFQTRHSSIADLRRSTERAHSPMPPRPQSAQQGYTFPKRMHPIHTQRRSKSTRKELKYEVISKAAS